MSVPRPPLRKRIPRKNLVAIDGTLDRVVKMVILVQEKGVNAEPFELRIQHRESVHEHIDCNNPACHNGGFSLGNVLREMVGNHQEEFIGTSFCTGQEGDPEEGGPHPSCTTRYEIQAILRYR